MGKAIWVWVVVSLLLLAGQAFALERQLAGVRLGQSAIELLTNRDFLSPAFVGPVGLSVSPAPIAIPAGQPLTGPVTGPAAPSPAAPPRAAPGAGQDYMSREIPLQGAAPAPMPTYRGAGAYRPSGPVSPAAAIGAPPTGVLWLYRRPGGVFILVEMNAEGKVYAVSVQGRAYAGAQTARGVRLGDSYTRILSLYGYPDSNQNEGTHFVLRYYDHGLTLRLYQMKVAVITLSSQPVAAPSAAAPAMGVAPAAPTPMPSVPIAPQVPGVPTAPPSGGDYM